MEPTYVVIVDDSKQGVTSPRIIGPITDEVVHGKTPLRVEPAYGFAQVEQMLDALHTPRKASA